MSIRKQLFCTVVTLLVTADQANAQTIGKPMVIKSTPEFLKLYNGGVDDMRNKDNDAAILKFKAAIDVDPKIAPAHLNYGLLLMYSGKYNEAQTELLKAKSLDPKMPAVYGNLGAIYQTLGNDDAAVENFKKYLEMDPNNPSAARIQSVIGMLQGDLDRRKLNRMPNGPDDYIGDATEAGVTRWPENRMPIKISIKPGNSVPGYRDAFEEILKQSFTDWVDASQGKVRIQYVDNPIGADIVCGWTDNPREMISSAEGGHAMVGMDKQGVTGCTLTLLTVRPDTQGKLTDNFARRIALHEVGHALGILAHSPNPDDIMFNTVLPADIPCGLSSKDKNTLVALYSLDADVVAKHPPQIAKMISGDNNSIVVRSTKLNLEGNDAMEKKDYLLAAKLFDEARRVDPGNDVVIGNLGVAYGNYAAIQMNSGNNSEADQYFKRSLPLLEKCSSKTSCLIILKNYRMFLKRINRMAEADSINSKITALGGE
jgi:tetratricopeptide (TPR) repeat protein